MFRSPMLLICAVLMLFLPAGAEDFLGPDDTEYPRFRIVMSDSTVVEGTDGSITRGRFIGNVDGTLEEYDRSEMAALYKFRGTDAVLGGSIGALVGLGTYLAIGISESSFDGLGDTKPLDEFLWEVNIALAAGALVGVLIGSTSEHWELMDMKLGSEGFEGRNGASVGMSLRF